MTRAWLILYKAFKTDLKSTLLHEQEFSMTTESLSNYKLYLWLSRTETSLYLEVFVRQPRLMHLPMFSKGSRLYSHAANTALPNAQPCNCSIATSPYALQHLAELSNIK